MRLNNSIELKVGDKIYMIEELTDGVYGFIYEIVSFDTYAAECKFIIHAIGLNNDYFLTWGDSLLEYLLSDRHLGFPIVTLDENYFVKELEQFIDVE